MSDVQARTQGVAVGEARYRAAHGDTSEAVTAQPTDPRSVFSGITGGRADVPTSPQPARWPGYYDSGLHWTETAAGQMYLRRSRTGRL